MTEHIILRDLNAGGSIAGPYEHTLGFPGPVTFGAPSAGPAGEAGAPAPQVESADLDDRDVLDLSRDPQIAGLAPVIPTCLIAPVASEAGGTGDSWGIGAIGADASPFNGEGVVVAVLDTGIDAGHDAFSGVDLVEVDFTGSGNGDQQGHGTHCAGTIFGRDVGGRRIGVARGVGRALIGKVLGADGRGTSIMAFRGMQWAADEGADVISMSLGFDFPGHVAKLVAGGWPVEIATSVALVAYRANLRVFDSLMAMMQARAAILRGPVVVAAAGNESRTNIRPDFTIAVSLPAAAEGIISVGALRKDGDLFDVAPFSNRFPEVSAPGVDIVSARRGGGLVANSGTSMACPHVAGVAALWTQALRSAGHTQLTPVLVRAKILAGAHTDRFMPHVTIPDRGAGRIVAPT